MEIRARNKRSAYGLGLFSTILILGAIGIFFGLDSLFNISTEHEDKLIPLILIGVPVFVFVYFYSTSIEFSGDEVIIKRFFKRNVMVISNLVKLVEYREAGLIPQIYYYNYPNPKMLIFYDSSKFFPKTFFVPCFDANELQELINQVNSKVTKEKNPDMGYLKVNYWIDRIVKWGFLSIVGMLMLILIVMYIVLSLQQAFFQ